MLRCQIQNNGTTIRLLLKDNEIFWLARMMRLAYNGLQLPEGGDYTDKFYFEKPNVFQRQN
jgi:hypothetical protein